MATTTNRGYRYPVLTDTPDIPRDISNLANDVDADMAGTLKVTYSDQSGTTTLTTAAQQLCALTLNAGKYRISGWAQYDWSIGGAGRLYILRLATAASQIGNATNHIAPLTATSGSALSVVKVRLAVDFLWQNSTDGTAVSLQAYMDATGGTSTVYNGHIEARPVTF